MTDQGASSPASPAAAGAASALTCGCRVATSRDFLGRLVGTILARGPGCVRDDHQPGKVVAMPGRDAARPE